MRKLLLYKYQTNDKIFLERNLDFIINSKIWASKIVNLNDPNEGLFNFEDFECEMKYAYKLLSYGKMFRNFVLSNDNIKKQYYEILKLSTKVGIYSTTSNPSNELMWVHYSNNHKGYCLEFEFNLEELTNFKKLVRNRLVEEPYDLLQIKYLPTTYRPNISILNKQTKHLTNDLLSIKSSVWSYEQEIRLLFSNSGVYHYDPNCLKGIIFGYRMNDSEKKYIIKKLSKLNIVFYNLKKREGTFEFYKEKM